MATIPPIVQYAVACDDVAASGALHKVSLHGLTHTIRVKPGVPFPIIHPVLCLYVLFSGGVGTGRVQAVVVDADTEEDQFGSTPQDYHHSVDRHSVAGITFRLQRCVFRRPGLYWVEFRHDGVALRRLPLIVR